MDLNSIRKDDIRAFEDFLAKYSQLLHPNHAAMMEVCVHKIQHITRLCSLSPTMEYTTRANITDLKRSQAKM